jgi:DNA repair protein RecO (recombination protein O)
MIDAYVIHKQAYRETSLLVDFITPEFGRVSTVYKGARKKKGKSFVEPFQHYRISWAGRTDLKVLSQIDCAQVAPPMQGAYLFSGLYLNELLYYVLPLFDENRLIFSAYEDALAALFRQRPLEQHLRHFELQLLSALGYGIAFDHEYIDDKAIIASQRYQFIPGQGFSTALALDDQALQFDGELLLQIASGDWQSASCLQALKRINRSALGILLKGRTLRSRQYFATQK